MFGSSRKQKTGREKHNVVSPKAANPNMWSRKSKLRGQAMWSKGEEVLRDVTIWIKTNLSQFDITDANGYTIDINDIVYFINQKLNTK